jgi:hypothetical protein
MLKKILLSTILIGFIGYVSAQTDGATVKKDTVTAKDTLTKKAVNKIDSTIVKKDTVAKTMNPVAIKQDTTTVKKDTAEKVATSGVINADKVIEKKSPVKTLTYKQYDALIKGEDLYDMALPATLNHYPMPDDVIKYKKGLDLSPIQISKITAIGKELHRKRVEMGPIIIRNENMLDSLFRTHNIDDGTLIFYANRYGLYQGEIRNAILQACYATEILLSPAQVKRLEELENHK